MAEELKSIVAVAVPGSSHPRANLPTAAEDSGSYTEPVRCPHRKRGETAAHIALKRLALLWAQSRGYSGCAFEVQLPRCRFRADLAAYRPNGKEIGTTAIFECKQAFPDLRRDNSCSAVRRSDWKRFSNVARSWKKICAFIIPLCASPIRFSPTSIHITLLRLSIAAMPESCES